MVVSGSLTVPSGSGAGTLVITVNNKASSPINAVTIATDAADTGLSVVYAAQNGANSGTGMPSAASNGPVAVLCGTLTAAQLAIVTGCAASNTFAIPIGSSASAIGAVAVGGANTGAIAGTTYTFTVSCYLGTSTSPNIQTFSVTAQI